MKSDKVVLEYVKLILRKDLKIKKN